MAKDLTAVIHDYRRDQVIAAARTLLESRGSSDLSLTEVAAAAGVSRSTLYNHFSTREDVLAACLAAAQREFADATRRAVAEAADPLGRLSAFLRAPIEQVDANPSFFSITPELLRAGTATAHSAVPEVNKLAAALLETLGGVLADGAEHGVLAFDDLSVAEDLVLTTLIGGVYRRSFDRSRSPADVAAQLTTALVAGLRPAGADRTSR